jgi:hypothetical protein
MYLPGNAQKNYAQPDPTRTVPGGTVERRTAERKALKEAARALDARHQAMADAATEARIRAGNGTLQETAAWIEQQAAATKTTTSQTIAKPASGKSKLSDLLEQQRQKIAAAEKTGGKVVSGAIVGKFW